MSPSTAIPPGSVSSSSAVASCSQRCLNAACDGRYAIDQILTACPKCGELLDVEYDWGSMRPAEMRDYSYFLRPGAGMGVGGGGESSGVWQFRELMNFQRSAADIVSIGEGKTILQRSDSLAGVLGFDVARGGGVHLQYEGLNPSGSFKDNGMTAAFTHARMVGAKVVACASTGNTSAAMAVYALRAGMKAIVFIGDGKIAFGKLSQALDYGAVTLQVKGDFDACLARVQEIAVRPVGAGGAGVYLMNSVNPFRLEGQKSVMFRVLRDLGLGAAGADQRKAVPDWVIVPGGNLGNCSAFGKAFIELRALGLIDRVPRLAVINAAGARTLDRMYNELGIRWKAGGAGTGDGKAAALRGGYDREAVKREYARMDAAKERAGTIASAIEINRPVNLAKALRALWFMDGASGGQADGKGREGVVRSVSDEDMLECKALVGRHGLGCEPASAASVAGAAKLLREGVIAATDRVVCILTGHQLKDPDATVEYHTGMQTKKAMESAPRGEARGKLANQPIKVADDLGAILKAMGL